MMPNKWNLSFYFPNVIRFHYTSQHSWTHLLHTAITYFKLPATCLTRFYLLLGFFPMLYTQMMHMYQLRSVTGSVRQSDCKNQRNL